MMVMGVFCRLPLTLVIASLTMVIIVMMFMPMMGVRFASSLEESFTGMRHPKVCRGKAPRKPQHYRRNLATKSHPSCTSFHSRGRSGKGNR